MLSRLRSEAQAWALFTAVRFNTAKADVFAAADRATNKVGQWLIDLLVNR